MSLFSKRTQPECTEVTKKFVLFTVMNNPEILDDVPRRDRRAVVKKFVKEYRIDAEDQYNCNEVFEIRDRGENF